MIDLDFDSFVDELTECGWRPTHDEGNKKLRKFWELHQPDGYDAKCIRVLRADEVAERFDWAKSGELAHKYKRDVNWVEMGMEACRRASVDPSYFIRRYLEKEEGIDKNPLVEQAYRDLRDGVV